jgi:hypothetical protein
MTVILIPYERPADLARRLVRAGMVAAFIAALPVSLTYFTAEKECRSGAFGAGFSSRFDVKCCDLVIKGGGDVMLRVRLPL